MCNNNHKCGPCSIKKYAISLNENLISPIILTPTLKRYIGANLPLTSYKGHMSKYEYLKMIDEARYLYSRGLLDVGGKNKKVLENRDLNLSSYKDFEKNKIKKCLHEMFSNLEGGSLSVKNMKHTPSNINGIQPLQFERENEFADLGDEFADLGDELADAIKKELEGKKDLNESLIGILGYILLSNTVAHMLSKFAKNQFAKHNFGKGEEAAKKIEHFTHKNEQAFKAPIKKVVGLFTKNEKYKKNISDVLYAIVILLMAGQAGGDGIKYIKSASYIKGGLYTIKSLIKGKEVHTILQDIISDIIK